MTGPQAAWLPGGRLHLNHGPIDLVIGAEGPGAGAAFGRARARFDGILAELVAELPALRSPDPRPLAGPVARRMAAAVAPFRPAFVTPMAAVAGAVADAILAAMQGEGLDRAYVNNGGDIALHLVPGQSLTAAVCDFSGLPARATIRHADRVRGIATSGWRGRSFSFGIADAVTVLAATAAEADAAATLIANAVDLPGHPAIARRPAAELQADTDLGRRLVTVDVGALAGADIDLALDAGLAKARSCLARGLIVGAALFLRGRMRMTAPGLVTLPEPLHA